MLEAPVSQAAVPAALLATRLITHVLSAGKGLFGIGSGGPKRQPVSGMHVPPEQSASVLQVLPAFEPPPHSGVGYSGFCTPAVVQVRLGCAPPMSVSFLPTSSMV